MEVAKPTVYQSNQKPNVESYESHVITEKQASFHKKATQQMARPRMQLSGYRSYENLIYPIK